MAQWRRQWHPTPVLLPGESHGQRSLVGCSPWGLEESDTTEQLYFHFSLSCIGEGNGNPLQCSWLEDLRGGGASWAAVYGVAQSWTRLKQLSSSSSRGPRLEDFAACFSFLAQTCCFMVQQSEGLALHLSCCEGCVVCKQKQKSGYCPPFTEQNPRSGQPSGAEQRLRGVLYFWEGGNYWAGEK